MTGLYRDQIRPTSPGLREAELQRLIAEDVAAEDRAVAALHVIDLIKEVDKELGDIMDEDGLTDELMKKAQAALRITGEQRESAYSELQAHRDR
jgi:division protein CdvB (Snf7/Vps24/ESCRT-III family)